jgi:cell division septal protein FtsQ
VQAVRVSGARFVDPDQARTLAAIGPEASVWDDPLPWEARVEAHPLVLDARVRRRGLTRLSLELEEVHPVALVPTPVLVPVDGDGHLLPIDPAGHALDLPILFGAELRDNSVDDEASRRALAALEDLRGLDSEFVSQVSELRAVAADGIQLVLLDGNHAERILLPVERPVQAFLRVEAALRECQTLGNVISADARFRGQVVVGLRGKS